MITLRKKCVLDTALCQENLRPILIKIGQWKGRIEGLGVSRLRVEPRDVLNSWLQGQVEVIHVRTSALDTVLPMFA
jgi:hypothetical protein